MTVSERSGLHRLARPSSHATDERGEPIGMAPAGRSAPVRVAGVGRSAPVRMVGVVEPFGVAGAELIA
jgi:hypothetical protein